MDEQELLVLLFTIQEVLQLQHLLLQAIGSHVKKLLILAQILGDQSASHLLAERPVMYCQLPYTPRMFTYFDQPRHFREHYRISLPAFGLLLTKTADHKRRGWSEEIEWCVFLAWIGCGTSYRVIGLAAGMARQTVCDIVHRRLIILLSICKDIIRLPTTSEARVIGEGMAARAQSDVFKCAVGAIDGSHINCHVPELMKREHINRKKRSSIQLQGLCDHNKKFIDVFVGYPGSVHDSRVLRNSPLYKEKLYPPQGYCILGDSGYPCIKSPIALMTPFRENEAAANPEKRRFNTSFSKARVVVEMAFGLLKIRWRCIFDKEVAVDIKRASEVVMCCCILHNICVVSPDDWETENTQVPRPSGGDRDESGGLALRDILFNQFLSANRRSRGTPAPNADHAYSQARQIA